MSVKERLIVFLKLKKISQSAFEKNVGLSNGYVNNIRNSIQPDKIQRISLRYPELNLGWILTGEGEMLKKNEDVEQKNSNPNEDFSKYLYEKNEILNQKIGRLERENELAVEEIEKLKTENEDLKNQLVSARKKQGEYINLDAENEDSTATG